MQDTIFSNDAAAPAPVFGVQASWLCFGHGLLESIEKHWKEHLKVEAYDMPEVVISYLYRRSSVGPVRVGQPSRIQCPALHFDRTGDFMEIWSDFLATARADAFRRTGHDFIGENEQCVTTAWQGETRPMILSPSLSAYQERHAA